jgi:hypothetical protein
VRLPTPPAHPPTHSFLIRQQQYLELLGNGDTAGALQVLRQHLAPLANAAAAASAAAAGGGSLSMAGVGSVWGYAPHPHTQRLHQLAGELVAQLVTSRQVTA